MKNIIHQENSGKLCDHGCGQPAIFYFEKTKKWSCSKSANSCPAVKARKKAVMKEKYGVENPSQMKEVQEKIRLTSLQKYGTLHPTKAEEVQAKKQKTNLEKYGVTNPILNDKVRAKRNSTNLERYGSISPGSDKNVQAKKADTMVERYGAPNPSEIPASIEKKKRTNLKRYGHEWGLQSNEVKQKIKRTSELTHGVSWPSKSEITKTKKRKTLNARYGVDYPAQIDAAKEKTRETNRLQFLENLPERNRGLVIPNFSESEYINSKTKHEWKCTRCATVFEDYARHGVIPRCPKCFPVNQNISKSEKEIKHFVESLGLEVIENSRDVIPPKEVDIFVPEKNIAIEFHGLYWHDSNHKDKKYHQTKMQNAEKAGVRMIQIFEDEWLHKREIVENRLVHILGKSDRIYGARQCEIKEVSAKDSKLFLEKHHIQGNVNAKIKLGAFYQDELVAVMTFGSLRKSMGSVAKEGSFELLRFAAAGVIPGIASKIMKHFMRRWKPDEIRSYCDLRWGTGEVYVQLGFELSHTTEPNYFYVVGTRRENRFKYRKSELIREGYDPSLTEREIMESRGIPRIYDAGHKLYVLKIRQN